MAPGAYVPADVDGAVPEQRVAEQAVRLPQGGAVTGWGSLRLHGATYFDGACVPVPLAFGECPVPRRHPDFTASVEQLDPAEIVVVQRVPCTGPMRALFDEARRTADWRATVVMIDMTIAAGLVTLPGFVAYVEQRKGWRRSSLVARALPYLSERSRSPKEVWLRLTWELDARLPRPLVNQEIFDLNGSRVCEADLLDPEAGLVVEYDGAAHRKRARHTKDVRREEACRRLGLEYCKVTGGDSTHTVVNRLLSTRSRAKFLPEEERAWLLQRPTGSPLPGFWRS